MSVDLHLYDGWLALILAITFWILVRMTLEFLRLCRWLAPHLARLASQHSLRTPHATAGRYL